MKKIVLLAFVSLSLLMMTITYALNVLAWSNGGYSDNPSSPDYGTHDWIAEHALDWLPENEKLYIEDNLATYLYGTELPDNGIALDGIGDTANHHIYYWSNGSLQDDPSVVRAEEEYNNTLHFFESGDLANASKTAGIMSHYIVDVAVFGHVMGAATDWGAEAHHSDYETYVNQRTSSYDAEFNIYLSFDGELSIISAYDATKELAYDTTFDVDGDLSCVWMDQNYNWSDPVFKDRCGESLNFAVNYLTDVLHTLYLEIAPVLNIDSGKNFSTIQEAINDNETLDGHTILVDAGTYYEHVTIDKTIALVGENPSNTTLDGNGTDIIVLIFAENVCVSGFTIQNGLCGICLAGLIGTTKPMMSDISNNIITSNEQGIDAVFSHNNTITDNIIQNNSRGIFLSSCGGTILRHNNMSHNSQNFGVGGYTLSDFSQNVDATNTVDGKPIYYWVNQRDKRIPADAGYVAAVNSLNITVENLNLKNNREGVLFAYTTNSTIENVNVSNCSYGFKLHNSNRNTIVSNVVSNGEEGIRLQSSGNNSIIRNTMIKNTGYEYHAAGIHLIYGSSGNVINGNAMSENYCGIRFTSSNGTIVQHNNFVNNTYQVLGASYDNVWDDGYPSGGNYWSDYSDTDFFSGPFQNETGSDGIGDMAYTIDSNNTDNYPLMGMFSDFFATSEYHVQTICNSTISDFQFNGTAISFNVAGENGTTGFCRIHIPTALMNDTYRVFINSTEVSYILLLCFKGTHSYLYFTYNHSTQEVIIIPEFPTGASMLVILVILTVAVVIYKRRLFKTPIH